MVNGFILRSIHFNAIYVAVQVSVPWIIIFWPSLPRFFFDPSLAHYLYGLVWAFLHLHISIKRLLYPTFVSTIEHPGCLCERNKPSLFIITCLLVSWVFSYLASDETPVFWWSSKKIYTSGTDSTHLWNCTGGIKHQSTKILPEIWWSFEDDSEEHCLTRHSNRCLTGLRSGHYKITLQSIWFR